jgi:hypothetical protein
MNRVAVAATEPVNDWKPNHETSTLLAYTGRVIIEPPRLSPEQLSELLTRKFREIFP